MFQLQVDLCFQLTFILMDLGLLLVAKVGLECLHFDINL